MIKGWSEATAGIFRHWDRYKKMLSGNACMHIVLHGELFTGIIQLSPEFDPDLSVIYKTVKRSFEECTDDLEGHWEDLIKIEWGEIEYG